MSDSSPETRFITRTTPSLSAHVAERRRSSTLRMIFLAVLCGLLIHGCSGGTQEPEATPTPVAPTAAPSPTPTPGPTATPFITPTSIPSPTVAPTPENLIRGGVFRIAIPEGPPHSDPHLTVSSSVSSWGAGLAYSRLLKFDTTGGSTTVTCDLCESWVQSDPLTFSFKLRDGIRWHNADPVFGRDLTAQDVVYSLNRVASAGSANAALFSNVAEFSVSGDREVLIRLIAPDSEILEKLADSHARIVAHETVETHGDLRRGPTVGTGPWIANEIRGDFARLSANSDYYGNGTPYLDALEVQIMPSQAVRAAAVRSQVIDATQASVELIDAAQESFSEINRIDIPNPASGIEVAMNTARSPMDRRAVREAMMLSWRPAGDENADSELGVTSLGLPLIDSAVPTDIQQSLAAKFNDPTRANSLLATAALAPTDNVIIKVGEFGEQYIDQANLIAEGLAGVGIRADVERVSTRVFGDEVWIGGDYDIMVGAPPPVASTTSYLFAVHHSNGPWNTTSYDNPELDALIEAQAREYDPTRRSQMLHDIQKLILEGSHRFIISHRFTHWMHWDYVQELNPLTPRGDTDFLTRVWLNESPN